MNNQEETMTNQHPLTDEMCDEIFKHNLQKCDEKYYEWQNRALRAAADWQLEQVIEWLDFELYRYTDASFDGVTVIDYDNLFKNLKEAMRSQEDNS